MDRRRRAQGAARIAAVGLVVAWFFVPPLRSALPFWVPFAILVAVEAEFLVRGLLEARRGFERDPDLVSRRAPGSADADLGWGELVEEVTPEGDVSLRLLPPPPRPPRRSARRAYAAGALIAGALFVVAFRADRETSWSSLSAAERAAATTRITREATSVAGTPVSVSCDESYSYTGVGSDALGIAFIRRSLAYLEPGVCRTLHDIISGKTDESDTAAMAVLVLAHEAVHLRGETREGVTECLGLQEGVALAERLGYGAVAARALMRRRYEASLAEREISRLSYRLPPGCSDGGSFDLRPDDSRFP
jgi:hypothetical protein